MRALTDLLEFAIELDTGRYSHSTAPVILYVIRLVVRIESFMLFVVRHHYDSERNIQNGTGFHAILRGLDITRQQCKMLLEKRKQLRHILNEQVFPMLDRWCEVSTKNNEMQQACQLHAHLAFLFFHIPPYELTRSIVATLLSSQIFLTTRYRYDLAAESGESYARTVLEKDIEEGLVISYTEMFDLYQRQRRYDLQMQREIIKHVQQIKSVVAMDNVHIQYVMLCGHVLCVLCLVSCVMGQVM